MKCIAVLGLTILLVTFGEGLKCYVCDSDSNASCTEPIPSSDLLVDCETVHPGADICVAHMKKKDGKECTYRNCSSIGDDLKKEGAKLETCVGQKDGSKACECFTDGCNILGRPKDK